jgi:hypothetical protein
MQRMSILVTNGGLWGDSVVFWISKYLQHPFHVWNKNNGQIMSKVGNEYNDEILHIVYGNDHFEPANVHNEITNVVNVYNYDVNNLMSKKFIMKEIKKMLKLKEKDLVRFLN